MAPRNPAGPEGGAWGSSGVRAGGGAAVGAAGGTGGSAEGSSALAPELAQALNDLQLRDRAGELGLGFGERDVPAAVPERILGALLGGERRRLVDIPGAQRRVGEHRDFVGLHLERAPADEKVMLFAVGSLHAN